LTVFSFSKSQPDLVLTDINMPVMNDNAATIAIRMVESGQGCKRCPIRAVGTCMTLRPLFMLWTCCAETLWRDLRCTRLVDKRVDSPPMNLPRYVLEHVNDSFHMLVIPNDRMLVGRRIFEKIRSDNYLGGSYNRLTIGIRRKNQRKEKSTEVSRQRVPALYHTSDRHETNRSVLLHLDDNERFSRQIGTSIAVGPSLAAA
jgi:hypothetical protein